MADKTVKLTKSELLERYRAKHGLVSADPATIPAYVPPPAKRAGNSWTVFPTKNAIPALLQQWMQQMGGGRPIVGNLNISGHKYWWFLEYGTAARAGMGLPGLEGADFELHRPLGIKPGKPSGERYPITPRVGKMYSWVSRTMGYTIRRRRKMLRYIGAMDVNELQTFHAGQDYGAIDDFANPTKFVFRGRVSHPGIRPVGAVRIAVARFHQALQDRLLSIAAGEDGDITKLTRKRLVDIVNLELLKLEQEVIDRFPKSSDAADFYPPGGFDDSNPNFPDRDEAKGSHLIDSISVTLAR